MTRPFSTRTDESDPKRRRAKLGAAVVLLVAEALVALAVLAVVFG